MGSELAVRDEQLPAKVDPQTGEIFEAVAKDFSGYAGVATVSLSQEQAEKLMAQLPDEAHDILPTGEVYVSQVHYRRLLNTVFGPGGWALVPRGLFARQGNTITREYALVGPGGRFISEAIGEADYQPTNDRMSYATACEAVKSNALTRCCKDLGIASECWDKRFCEDFKARHCTAVWRQEQNRPQWRRKDAQPWHDETGAVDPKTVAAPPSSTQCEPGDNMPPPSKTMSCPHCSSISLVETKDGHLFCADCRRGIK